jgi:hypothetical protein
MVCKREAALIISCVAEDHILEAYWSAGRGAGIEEQLARLGPALVTSPNFSLFNDVPRWDNFHNMKRIALCWYELAAQNLAVALHINGRTDQDWQRWFDFLKTHHEIDCIAFEFKTGPAAPARGQWYANKLGELSGRLGRKMRLVMRGGRQYIQALRPNFDHLTFVTTDPVMRTFKRRRLVRSENGRARWVRNPLPHGHAIDRLLQSNIDNFTEVVEEYYAVGGVVDKRKQRVLFPTS